MSQHVWDLIYMLVVSITLITLATIVFGPKGD